MRTWAVGMILIVGLAVSGCVPSETIDVDEDESPGTQNTTAYLERVTSTWSGEDVPGDEELLELGEDACEQLDDGAAPDEIELFDDADESEQAQANTQTIVEAAALSLCPTDAD